MKVEFLNKNTIFNHCSFSVVTFGFFDGFHLGHQEILQRVIDIAQEKKYESIVFTFSPNVLAKIKKNNAPIHSLEEQLNLFDQWEIDFVYILDNLLDLTPQEFIANVLEKVQTKVIVTGNKVSFGKNGIGKQKDLQQFHLVVVDDIFVNKEQKISSSYIRQELQNHRFVIPYFLEGFVKKGLQNGTKMHFPTANITINKPILLPQGVYFGVCYIGEKKYPAMINIGTNPTIHADDNMKVEAHLLDYTGVLYHRYLKIMFLTYHREEKKFASIDDLKKQLEEDIQKLREYIVC